MLTLLIGVCAVGLTGCASKLMLFPGMARRATALHPIDPRNHGHLQECVSVTNRNGFQLRGWMFSHATNRCTVIVAGGNAMGLAHTYYYNSYLIGKGFNVLVCSYQGFDENGGDANLASLSGDLDAFYSLVLANFPGQHVAFVGDSISAAAVFCYSSRHQNVSCMVIEGMVNTKTVSFAKVGQIRILWPLCPITLPLATVVSATVPNELSIQRALRRTPKVPLLLIHHPADIVTPYSSARKIFDKYPGPKELIEPDVSVSRDFHLNLDSDHRAQARVVDFLRSHFQH